MIVYAAIGAIVKAMVKNHRTDLQVQCAAVGIRVDWEVAGFFMFWWEINFKESLTEQFATVLLYDRYVNDINIFVRTNTNKFIVENTRNIWRSSIM